MDDRLIAACAALAARAIARPPAPSPHEHPALDDLYGCLGGASGGDLAGELLGPSDGAAAAAELAAVTGWAGARVIARDDQGNLAAVFVGGDLDGMVAIYDHDDERARPAYASVAAFVEALAASRATALPRLEPELPRRAPGSAAEVAREQALFAQARAAFVATRTFDDAWVALATTPADDLDALAPFLDAAAPPWVRETAHEVAARVHGDRAVPALERYAEDGPRPNAPIVAVATLRRLDTPVAHAALARLRPALPEFAAYFPRR